MRPLILNDPPAKTRSDYASLSTDEVYRLIGEYNAKLEYAPLTEDGEDECRFALRELRAVLLERQGKVVRLHPNDRNIGVG